MSLLAKKRRASAFLAEAEQDEDNPDVCCFCRHQAAAVAVRTTEPLERSVRTTTTVTRSYCLLHYYTTPAVRVLAKHVTIIDPFVYDQQLPAAQSLFAEAFVQLQQELSEATARAATHQQDPLAMLHHIHKKAARKKAPPVPQVPDKNNDGGFLRHVATPERLLRTQQAQARKQAALLKRMERAAQGQDEQPVDPSKRRKSSRKSIWNVVMDQDDNKKKKHDNDDQTNATTTAAAIYAASEMHSTAVCLACQSQRVRILTSHNAETSGRKGEIWGGAGDLSSRVQCLDCGRMWNEEE